MQVVFGSLALLFFLLAGGVYSEMVETVAGLSLPHPTLPLLLPWLDLASPPSCAQRLPSVFCNDGQIFLSLPPGVSSYSGSV